MIGHDRFNFIEIGSTNDVARAGAATHVSDGAIYVAEHQTAGRGRRGASWNATPGESVLMSVVVYPNGDLSLAWKLGWVACVSIIDTLKGYGIAAQCKWPNDVIVGGKKIAGVLVETAPLAQARYAGIVGIGVNVQQKAFGDPSAYRIPPTSMAIEVDGKAPSVNDVVVHLCHSLDRYYDADFGNWDLVAGSYRAALYRGELQTGVDPRSGEALTGILSDIREFDGAAQLKTDENAFVYVFPEIAAA